MKNILTTMKTLLVLLVLGSCSDSYLDVNVDPNNPITVSPNLILPVALNYTAGIEERDRGQNHLGNMFMGAWSQSDGFSWYNDEFLYLVTPSFYQRIFDTTYGTVLKQYKGLEVLEGAEYGNYQAISKIMQAMHFQILVDTYGDVPYSEALQRGVNPTPKYDDAEAVYDGLIGQLTAAINLISATADVTGALVPSEDDGVFAGDMSKWKKFANSLKLRILVRQSDLAGKASYIQEQFSAISAEGSGYMTDDVMINIGYSQTESQQNPKWNGLGEDVSGTKTLTNNATCATPYVLDRLTDTNDGRLNLLFEEPDTGHLGVVQGLQEYDSPVVDQYVPDLVSNIGPGILRGPDQGAVIYTAAEAYFNLAEAALKGFTGDDAQTMYESGITASFDYLGASGASAYYAQDIATVGWAASSNKLEAIIVQKWLGVMGINALQSWFDFNRTGYPSDVPMSLLSTKPNRPVRLSYPSSELTANSNNLPTQQDVFSSKIFWAN
ncbi:SusD/RagB family nutrient-binding outer membrane lipoprotein [Flavobacteriaceae bacterium]|jgi:hypothetical protein|nr:SusD/RagB family nutrient-binding outer membrane lipoprotein [Flavobacteriaceae bacterium]